MKKKSNKINFKSNSSRAIYNYVLENNYKITVKQACDELAVTPSQVYSLIGLLRKKGMNVRVIRKSVERQIYREARQYIEEHNCEISIAKACRDLNVSREQLNNMIHKFRKNGMQISIIQASDIIKLPLNKNTEEAVYQYIVDHNYSISSRQMRTDLSLTKQQTKSFLQKFRRKGIEITVVESKKRNSDAQPQYIPLTQDQIALAQHTDIVEYLRERGEKVQKEGNHYIWEKHDSCVIHGYKWYQNSTGKHGAAVAFVQNFFHKSFPHAVLELIGNRQITFDLAAPPPTKRESKPTDMIPVAFCLPPAAPDNRRLYAYLTHTRSIAHEIVNTFIDEHLIYQDKQGNIVFVCYDCFGRVKSAHKRGTNSAQRYRSFVTGGEFNCGFSYANDNATVLYVFEAPIDLMSFLTLHRHKPWHRASYLSLGGLSEDPLRRFLKEHKSIQRIAFCFDNDINKPENRGQEAAKRFMRQFSGKYITSILCPCKKDWNDVLRDKIQKGEFL